MGNVVGEPFEKYVADQINIRQNLHGKINRTGEDLAVLNSKTAWVKLASGVSLGDEFSQKDLLKIGKGIDLARRYVLFGGVSSLLTDNTQTKTLRQRGLEFGDQNQRDNILDPVTGTYNINQKQLKEGQDFGYVPMPGIISVNIQNLNRGSIKKAELKIKAYSRDQFDILDVLYMRLGYTVLLEWGNSLYYENPPESNSEPKIVRDYYTLTEDPQGIFSVDPKHTHRSMLRKIEGYRESKSGNYDALLAKVSNFSWNFMPDGTYEITLSLISLGDVIESLKINTLPSIPQRELINSYIEKTKEDELEPTSIESGATSNIISFFLFYLKYNSTPLSKDIFYEIGSITKKIGYFLKLTNKPFTQYIDTTREFSTFQEAQKYCLQEFGNEYILNESTTININGLNLIYKKYAQKNGGFLEVKGNLPEREVGFDSFSNPEKDFAYFKYDNTEKTEVEDSGFYVRFGALLQLIQTECIPIEESTEEAIINIDYNTWGEQDNGNPEKSKRNRMLCYPNQYSYNPQVCVVRSSIHKGDRDLANIFPQLQQWRKDDYGFAYIMNIYINSVAIQDAIDSNLDDRGDLALYPFLETLCTKINEALGGINNLEPVIDEETNTLRIIDGSYSTDKKDDSYFIEMYGYNTTNQQSNFVRNVNLKTEITPEYASMITIGATAGGYVKGTDGTMFSKWNKGIIDRFKEKFIPPNRETQENPDEARDAYYNLILSGDKKILGYKVSEFQEEDRALDPDIISENVALATEYYKYLHAKSKENNENFSSTIGFIPFNLSLTIDGISGIKIYNKLNVNTSFLPTNYPKNLKFIIKGVNHVLQNSDWETTLETVVTSENLFSDNRESYNYVKDLIYNHIKEAKVSSPNSQQSSQPPPQNCPVWPSTTQRIFKTDQEMVILTKKIFPELTNDAIAGLLGHLRGESEFNSNSRNTTGGGCGAFGLAQWRGERQINLFKFAQSNNLDILGHETQLKFIKRELKTKYQNVWTLIQTPNLNIYQYLAIPHISYGLGNSNPYGFYKDIISEQSYLNEYTRKNGKKYKRAKARIKFAKEFQLIIK